MSYLVLARKWRPQRFEDVIGQEHVTATLARAIAAKRVAHAFLFVGPRGVGKTTVARILAKALNCTEGPRPDPCGKCSSCLQITEGYDLDVVEMDAASHTQVEHIRDLNESAQYMPSASRFRIFIIDEVHMLSASSFNALLKTLEEPPEHVKFIFATTDPRKILPTVLSRCQRYNFKRIPTARIIERLGLIVKEEGIKASEGALLALAREADGSMRDAQSLLDQVTVFAGSRRITEKEVRESLGVANRRLVLEAAEAVVEGNGAACLKTLDELYTFGYDVPQFARVMLELVRNLTVARLFKDKSLLTDLSGDEADEVMELAARRSPEDLQRMFQVMLRGNEELARSDFPRLVLEMTLLKMVALPALEPIGELVSRLEALEERFGGGSGGSPGGQPKGGRGGAAVGGAGRGIKKAPSGASTAAASVPSAAPERGGNGSAVAQTQGDSVRAFIRRVTKAEMALGIMLEACKVSAREGELHIEACSDAHFKGLQEAEKRGRLGEIAREIFGSSVTVRIAEPGTRRHEVRLAQREAERAMVRSAADKARENPAVKAALTILGGEISEIRVKRQSR